MIKCSKCKKWVNANRAGTYRCKCGKTITFSKTTGVSGFEGYVHTFKGGE
jgi:hypothetical protein